MQRERVGMDRKMNYALALLLVTAIGYFVLDRTVLRRHSAQATQRCEVDRGAAAGQYQRRPRE